MMTRETPYPPSSVIPPKRRLQTRGRQIHTPVTTSITGMRAQPDYTRYRISGPEQAPSSFLAPPRTPGYLTCPNHAARGSAAAQDAFDSRKSIFYSPVFFAPLTAPRVFSNFFRGEYRHHGTRHAHSAQATTLSRTLVAAFLHGCTNASPPR